MTIDPNRYYIVRADRAGVFFGKISEMNMGVSCVMTDVRKIHYWEGACAVEQISQDGVIDSSRLTVVVNEIGIANPIQALPCTERAAQNLKGKKEWKK